MSIKNFLNPTRESTIPEDNTLTLDKLLNNIIASHISSIIEPVEEEDKRGKVTAILTTTEALQAIKLLFSYSESQPDSVTTTIRVFKRFERNLERKFSELANQRTLDSYFGMR
jgi:hypothetical protein